MAWTWDFILQAFKALGGAAENITVRKGPAGATIAAADPEKPVQLYAPENLLFPVSEVEVAGGRLKIKDASSIGKGERSLFENFYDSFAWSDRDREQAAAFLQAFDALPDEIHDALLDEFGAEIPAADSSDRVDLWLLQRRVLYWHGKPVLVPVLDLVGHDPKGLPYDETNGIFLSGTFAAEVHMQRKLLSPFGAFLRFGIASPERAAFSLPMELNTEGGFHVVIDQSINLGARLGSIPVPVFKTEGRTVRFSCVMVGSSRNPRLSRGIFYRIMKDAGETKPDQVFDNILHINQMSFLKLLDALERYDGGMIPTLKKVAHLQLEAMTWCIGARSI